MNMNSCLTILCLDNCISPKIRLVPLTNWIKTNEFKHNCVAFDKVQSDWLALSKTGNNIVILFYFDSVCCLKPVKLKLSVYFKHSIELNSYVPIHCILTSPFTCSTLCWKWNKFNKSKNIFKVISNYKFCWKWNKPTEEIPGIELMFLTMLMFLMHLKSATFFQTVVHLKMHTTFCKKQISSLMYLNESQTTDHHWSHILPFSNIDGVFSYLFLFCVYLVNCTFICYFSW